MNLQNFRFEVDAEGVALATWDMPGRSMNVIDQAVMAELSEVIEKVASDPGIKGCVVTSGKDSFSAGADLTMLQGLGAEYARLAQETGEQEAMRFFFEESRRLSLLYRRLETCGKPFAAAVAGTCLGGAFELALACHYRVLASDDATRVGLPEIKVGLFPGAGGTQRIPRLMQTGDALQLLFRGDQLRALMAKNMGLAHEVVPRDAVVEKARAWILAGGSAVAPGTCLSSELHPEGLFAGRHDDLAAGQRDLPARDA
jgi:3-hydroxyacyl-CoA dehydrogenase/enoyl-CoA hydratase/3-hydroxybutyryl-CoA epimerase